MRFPDIDRRLLAGAAVFILLHVFLGIRSQMAADEVLASTEAGGFNVVARGDDPHGLRGLVRRDSLVRNVENVRKNPFRRPQGERPTPPVDIARDPTPARVRMPEPELLTLLHDDMNPCVQISVGDERSGWLHRGDSFRGWNVDDIAPASVTLAKSGRKVVLR